MFAKNLEIDAVRGVQIWIITTRWQVLGKELRICVGVESAARDRIILHHTPAAGPGCKSLLGRAVKIAVKEAAHAVLPCRSAEGQQSHDSKRHKSRRNKLLPRSQE